MADPWTPLRSRGGAWPAWLERAKKTREAAARQLAEARAALSALVASGKSGLELEVATRAAEMAELKASAARLAWFNTVVHCERDGARVRKNSLESDPEST